MLAKYLATARLVSEFQQVKVGRGVRAEAYGIAAAEAGLAFIASQAERKLVPRGRRARRGSRFALSQSDAFGVGESRTGM